MNNKIIFFFISLINSFYATNIISQNIRFFKNKPIYTELTNIINNRLSSPIIFNGDNTPYKHDFLKLICDENNINMYDYTFDKFIINKPYNTKYNSLIYINDFMINNGRILYEYENEVLLNKNNVLSNIIILESHHIENIPYKDTRFIRKLPLIQFPLIKKKDLIQYINDIIIYNKYNEFLYLIDWVNYDIQKLNLENINKLLEYINILLKDTINIDVINHSINNKITELSSSLKY
jgi:hypothetical protein